MNRLQAYKEIRRVRRRQKLILLFCVVMVIMGICISDYSVNKLMRNEKSIKIISLNKESNSDYVLDFMSLKFSMEIDTLVKDIERVKNYAAELIGLN